jgi:diguanylate cyclase (GGDEF)-like protein/PAS domain S-box-containing protein
LIGRVRDQIEVDFSVINSDHANYEKIDSLNRQQAVNIVIPNQSTSMVKDIAIKVVSQSLIQAVKVIKDYNGKDLFYIQTRYERSFNNMSIIMQIYTFVVVVFVGVFISLFLGYSLFNSISKPIMLLKKELDDFDVGNMNIDQESQPLSTNLSELQSLSLSFHKMKNQTIENHHRVVELNSILDAKYNEKTLELQKSNHQLFLSERVLKETNEGVLITDRDANIISVNQAFCKMSEYEVDELIGKNPRILKSDHHDKAFYVNLWNSILTIGSWAGEIWDRRRNGEVYPKWLTINAIKDENDNITHFISMSTDISHIKQTEEKLQQLAYYDSLTGLPNRALFYERLNRALTNRYNKIVALLFIDLDRFKNINDTMGHVTGDHVLKEVAKRISAIIRKTDTFCRLGGDEFTIILEYINYNEEIGIIATKIIREINKPMLINNNEIIIGASIGISLAPTDDLTVVGLLRKADSALYAAKEYGKNKHWFASKDLDQRNQDYLNMESMIRRALEKNEFKLFLQPQVSISADNMKIVGAEALIRIVTEDGKVIPPNKFIYIAEETNLIVPLGKWVIQEAGRYASLLQRNGIDIHISVNVSIKQFEAHALVADIEETLQLNGIKPESIQVEITESTFNKDVNKVVAILKKLKERNIKISIDDFGTGYSSLSCLGSLPIDYLKIDKSFIDNLTAGDDKELTTTIISMSKALRLKTIAEGVETLEQLELLKDNGCDEIQGYFFSKPLPIEQFMDYCKNFNLKVM